MPDASYFEVRCERCQSSFAPGTKRCVHCGGALGRRLLALDALGGALAGGKAQAEAPVGVPDASPSLGRIFRFAVIALAVVAAIARSCLELG